MLANASGTYSIMIRANLESDDILITSNNQLAFGQKLQVCCFVNMNSIQLTKKNKTGEATMQCLNTEKYGTWSDWPRKYRIQNTTVQNTEYIVQNTEYRIQNTTIGVLGGVQQRLLSELHQGGLLLPQADPVHEEVILKLSKGWMLGLYTMLTWCSKNRGDKTTRIERNVVA